MSEHEVAVLRSRLAGRTAGFLVAGICMATSATGVFARADIRLHPIAQLAASAGDGATASVAAHRWLVAP